MTDCTCTYAYVERRRVMAQWDAGCPVHREYVPSHPVARARGLSHVADSDRCVGHGTYHQE